jgi:hypothetical protein
VKFGAKPAPVLGSRDNLDGQLQRFSVIVELQPFRELTRLLNAVFHAVEAGSQGGEQFDGVSFRHRCGVPW